MKDNKFPSNKSTTHAVTGPLNTENETAISPAMKITGVKINYYHICHTKLWLFSHNIETVTLHVGTIKITADERR